MRNILLFLFAISFFNSIIPNETTTEYSYTLYFNTTGETKNKLTAEGSSLLTPDAVNNLPQDVTLQKKINSPEKLEDLSHEELLKNLKVDCTSILNNAQDNKEYGCLLVGNGNSLIDIIQPTTKE